MRKVVEGFLSAKLRAKMLLRPMPIQMQEHYDRKNINQPTSEFISPKEEDSSMEQVNNSVQDPHDSTSTTSKTPTPDTMSAIESSPKSMIPAMSAIGETSSEFIQHLKSEDSNISTSSKYKYMIISRHFILNQKMFQATLNFT